MDEVYQLAYEQLCVSYHHISAFRAQLLALLPIVSGAGVVLLERSEGELSPWLLAGLGAFGFFVTLGLFFYELRGIQRCKLLIDGGQRLETLMGLTTETGQFLGRAGARKPLGFIGSETAGWVVYLTLIVAWTALALIGTARVIQ
jgi:hypothetical protein